MGLNNDHWKAKEGLNMTKKPWALKDQEHEDGMKPTNPKDAVGIKKVPFSTVPAGVIAEVAVAMAEGALKYGRHNYRTAGVRASVYYDAAIRHLTAWWEGESIDPDSNLSHVTKAIASLTVLRDSMLSGNWEDDRPPSNPIRFPELNEKVDILLGKYPNAPEAHTQIEAGRSRLEDLMYEEEPKPKRK